jgi:hypothetical protein
MGRYMLVEHRDLRDEDVHDEAFRVGGIEGESEATGAEWRHWYPA